MPRALPSLGYEADVADGFTAEDFTIDCNVAGQFSSQLTCGAISLRGSHTMLRRLRAINFGRQGPAKRVAYARVTPLINKNNDPIYYFNNVSSGGRLVPGTMGESGGVGGSWASPVNDVVEAALVMALL